MDQDQPQAGGGGRRRRAARRDRRGTVLVVALAVCAAAVIGAVAVRATSGDDPRCTGTLSTLSVVATPELAGLISDVADRAGRTDGRPCWSADVTALAAAEALDRVRSSAPPDVWVPDSSVWIRPSLAGELVTSPISRSLASSPVVLAAPAAAARLVPEGLLDFSRDVVSRDAALQLALPDPARSSASLAMLLDLDAETSGSTAGRIDAARVLRAARSGLPEEPADALAAATRDALTIPVSEQALGRYAAASGGQAVIGLRLPEPAPALDYPFVVLARDATTRGLADTFEAALRGDDSRSALQDAGFRAPATTVAVPPSADADAALRTYEALTRDSRLLAVVDVSGSMRAPVPGAGGASRIQLVREAAAEGLNVYPDGAHIGLWEFATDLGPGVDHRELVRVGPLTARHDGRTGRQDLARALAGIEATRADTGLYDTALAAVRSMRADYDPARANVVVLLSDGRNEDARGVSLEQLLVTLQREDDPARRVPVITIAYGPDTDDAALRAISQATGGVLYRSPDPRRISEVFLDAIARRPCLSVC